MKRIKVVYIIGICIFLFTIPGINAKAQANDLFSTLKQFPEVISVEKIEHNPFFKEAYEITIEQFLDHKNIAAGKFKQRVILSQYNSYSPVVFVTEGYNADYALEPAKINELSKILEANQIVVEHRFFGKSIPEKLQWEYLTVENAMADLHRIQKIFRRIYTNNNKWISTGISKGGQTTLAYKAYYPDDVDIWIPYVAPVNFGVEDGRHEKFLENVGTEKWRNKIREFQLTILNHREQVLPMLDSVIKANNYTFAITPNEVLDYCVLEYPFAYWQWGELYEEIPDDTMSLNIFFGHLMYISNPDYFSLKEIAPLQAFFVQAAKELGYYGYDIKPLQPYLSIKSSKGYLQKIFLSGLEPFKFNATSSKKTTKVINDDGNHVLMIYGAYDPWTASALKLKSSSKAVKFVIPKASHRIRIDKMPYSYQAKIYMLLETWLEED